VRYPVVVVAAAAAAALMFAVAATGSATKAADVADVTVNRTDVVYELADLAFNRLVAHNCLEAYDQEKCNQLSDMSAKDVRMYFGGLLPNNETVVAVLPDGEALLTGKPHDAFIVLDPFPAYKFGHPVFMFYVDLGVSVWKCESTEGVYTGPYIRLLYVCYEFDSNPDFGYPDNSDIRISCPSLVVL